MPYFVLGKDPSHFPPSSLTEDDGILAVGGDLSPERILNAYQLGIFPWYSEGLPILWHCPDPRFVLEPRKLHIPRSLRKQLQRKHYEIRTNTAFAQVLEGCAKTRRPGQRGTWITKDMKRAYLALHHSGHAHSVESFLDGKLVGGLYGLALGKVFFGESMFALAPDASKVAFVVAVQKLVENDFQLIDCQQETAHLARFGAEPWPRARFVERVALWTKGLQQLSW